MLFLFLVYFPNQSNLGGDASPISPMERRADIPCNDLSDCRNIWNITWSCLSTVLLCTWVTLHPNIAIAPDTHDMSWYEAEVWHPLRGFLKNKLILFLLALIAPDYIIAWAIRQYRQAGKIQHICNTSTDKYSTPVREWKRAHGFFLLMGGFNLYSLLDGATSIAYPSELSMPDFVLPLPGHSREREKAKHPLELRDFSAHALAYLAPTETEIKDRGKANIIAKILVILQTSWFVAQCIARGAKHLPLTELEVVTLAYATMNMFVYYFWWYKPKNVECPIRLYEASTANRVESLGKQEWSGLVETFKMILAYAIGNQDNFLVLSKESQMPMFWSGGTGAARPARSMFGASILGMAFGAIHFITWNSEFPSYIELLLWRISCVAMTAVPLTVTILCGTAEMYPARGVNPWLLVVIFTLSFPLPLAILLYFFARIATLVMAFTTLQAPPSDTFKTVDWATSIPHL